MHSSKLQSFTEELNWKSSKSHRKEMEQQRVEPRGSMASHAGCIHTGHNADKFGEVRD